MFRGPPPPPKKKKYTSLSHWPTNSSEHNNITLPIWVALTYYYCIYCIYIHTGDCLAVSIYSDKLSEYQVQRQSLQLTLLFDSWMGENFSICKCEMGQFAKNLAMSQSLNYCWSSDFCLVRQWQWKTHTDSESAKPLTINDFSPCCET